jgi:putative ABC transport system substrate-binding protein
MGILEDSTMRRSAIGLMLTLALGLLLAPFAAEAQQPTQVHRIGVLTDSYSSRPPPDLKAAQEELLPLGYAELEAFRHGLRDLGYVEGQSIALEYRHAEGKLERLPELAAEIVRLQVDIILAVGAGAVRAAQHATETIPIVFTATGDPVGQGFVASLVRPGGHTTGLLFQYSELMGKRLELLKEAVPGVTRVAYLWHVTQPSVRDLPEAERAAYALGLELYPVEVREPYAFDQAFATMVEAHVNALITQPGGVFFGRRTQLMDLAARMRLPGIFPEREFAEAGGLMSYGASVPAAFNRLATYVDKILKGAKPGDLPVEYPMQFELVINLKTAQALGLTIPPTLLFQADEIIR